MSLFDRTAKHLATGPTLVLPAARVDDVTDLLRRYDPGLRVHSDRFSFDNGVLLYGPVEVPAEAGMVAYYARVWALPKREERPEDAKLADGERLIRGLAIRLNGATHAQRPWAELDFELSVYAEQPVPPEQVINVLQPYAGEEDGRELTVDEHPNVERSYFLISEREPVFLTAFWPGYLSKSRMAPPPLALGPLRTREPCRWQLGTTQNVDTAEPEFCRLITGAALALAAATGGVVVDMYGFPVARPDEPTDGAASG
jgi:hypothetical protein